MSNFASRLHEAQNMAANTRANNIAEAHAIAESTAEFLVSTIESNAAKGHTHLTSNCEMSEKQLFCYTKLLELSTSEEGINSFKEALRDLTEGVGEIQVAVTVLNGIQITLTV